MNNTTQERQRQDRTALEAELKSAGADIQGKAIRCPFHEDQHPSGSVYQDQAGVWRFKCNAVSCGVGGDVFDIRARATGRSLEDTLREANPDTRRTGAAPGRTSISGTSGNCEPQFRGPERLRLRPSTATPTRMRVRSVYWCSVCGRRTASSFASAIRSPPAGSNGPRPSPGRCTIGRRSARPRTLWSWRARRSPTP